MSTIKREQPNYLAIGIFFFAGIIAVLIGVVFSDKLIYRIRGGYPISIQFNDLDGLTVGSKVIVGSGKSVGNIDTIELDGAKLIVTAFIDKEIQINQSASFHIIPESFVGGKLLSIENYTGEAPYYQANDFIIGVEPFSINTIIDKITGLFSAEDSDLTDGIGQLFGSLGEVSDQVQGLVGDNKTNFHEIVTNLTKSSDSLRRITANLDRKLSKISDAEFVALFNDLSTSISNLNIFLEDVNSPNAPLAILKDPKVNSSIRTIITNLEETTERVKAKPSLLLK